MEIKMEQVMQKLQVKIAELEGTIAILQVQNEELQKALDVKKKEEKEGK
ncbi:hypothetical protein [Ligilactobacillus equi]